MKIAISSNGKNLDSQIDPRFGRAAYILVVDLADETVEVLENLENANAFKGAGIQAASTVCDCGADVLLTGFCGPNAFRTLAAAGVKVVNDMSGTVRDALQEFKNCDKGD
ncbi:Dinitrogenase iron-molybdenum cofactor biosynthesis protein [Olavius algarvensis Delta 1 endosymbiont]|nr:Dinitrogenase iron-molybdenum cofactor biosynthesis protein [Olavius algarvensis Delta 1 endosymbiont]